ncbi:ATP-binding cassette domain-containing protein [Streptomyces sp. NPDC012769]|uniref:ABC transporter permease subunit n=1 Tax=Streptomyces sp. NPDC012769 TaxID=3364848 RepID=UPI003683857A
MASLTYDLVLAGLAVGSAAALTGIGLIVTYRATGVLNLAHGAIAMVCAYVLRQLVVEWGWPLPLGAAVTLLVVAPGIGLLLDRAVFRPLALAGAGPARTLVASIGVFVLLVGGAALLWGGGARDDAPVLLGDDPWAQLASVVALACLVGAVTRWTRFGRELRAVVDNRPLAVLSGIPADRVAAAGWAFGAVTAGLTGVLLAPYVRLDPYGMPLLVVEVIAVAVVARMRSLPVAVLAALALGVAQAQLTRLHPAGWAGELLQAAAANLFVVALLVAALVLPGVGDGDALPPSEGRLVDRASPRGGETSLRAAPRVPAGVWPVAAVLFALPLGFAGEDLTTAVQVPALAVILLSLVVVSGRGGQIALGQAAYAGLGALFTGLLSAAGLPELVALGAAVLCVAPLGLLTGWPAIRRHGLALALVTLAVGVAVSRFVFAQPYATAGVALERPAGFEPDRRYYVLELTVLACCLLLVGALRRGRTGRALAVLRDHERGAEAAGVRVAGLKLLAFVLGAALAALGGGLLGMGVRAFDPDAFDPVRGLLWFAAVLALGADLLLTPLLAATLLVALDAGGHAGVAAALIGLLATFTGRVPPLLTTLLPRFPGARRAGRRLSAPPPAGPGGRPDRTTGTRSGDTGAAEHPAADRAAPREPGAPETPTPQPAAAGPEEHGPPAAGPGPGTPPTAPAHTGGPDPHNHPAQGQDPGSRLPAPAPNAAPPGPGPARSPAAGQGRGAPPTADLTPEPPAPTGDPAAGPPHPVRPPAEGQGPKAPPTAPAHAGGPDPHSHSAQGRPSPDPPARAPGAAPPGQGPARSPAAAQGPGAPSTADLAPEPPAPTGDPAEGPPHPVRPPAAGPDSGGRPRATAGAPAPRLVAQGLRLTYPGGLTALDRVDLVLRPGRVTAVVGPNGAGKSTLFDCLAGTLRPTAGRVVLDGVDITRRPAHVRHRLGIARTFQQPAVFPSLTVEENVLVGGRGAPAEQALRLLGLAGSVRHRAAAGLPTGTLRRVELARALAGAPHTLLLDEPAAGLDADETAALARILAALAADGLTVLVVEHDPDLVAGIARTVHTMEGGRIVS